MYGSVSCLQLPYSGQHQTVDSLGVLQGSFSKLLKGFHRFSKVLRGLWGDIGGVGVGVLREALTIF